MAEKFGVNATKRDVTVPSVKIDVQDQHGRMRVAKDSYVLAGELALNDTVVMMELPAGAKVYDVQFSSPDLGTTGELDIGWQASADGGEVADPNGFMDGVDVTSAVERQQMLSTDAGYLKEFTEKVKVEIVATTATDVGDTLEIELVIYYVVD